MTFPGHMHRDSVLVEWTESGWKTYHRASGPGVCNVVAYGELRSWDRWDLTDIILSHEVCIDILDIDSENLSLKYNAWVFFIIYRYKCHWEASLELYVGYFKIPCRNQKRNFTFLKYRSYLSCQWTRAEPGVTQAESDSRREFPKLKFLYRPCEIFTNKFKGAPIFQ